MNGNTASVVLADTGALLAFVGRRDKWHERCKAEFAQVRLPLVTTYPVLTELFHLANRCYRSTAAVLPLLHTELFAMAPVGTADLPALHTLMTRYADRPMNFADATLVHVAQREQISTILTVDHDDFETYRIGRNRKFRILPAR
ncbi:MAG: type II toxin-antitoxin system VapC family toxin [Hyphomicrobium sp.]